jgi:Co/Zn/Cd efflux system component
MDDVNLDQLNGLTIETGCEVSPIASEILSPDSVRNENEKTHFHKLKIILIWIFGVFLIAVSFVVIFHLISPHCFRWLEETEVASLEKMFVTGIGAALIGKFGNKLVD